MNAFAAVCSLREDKSEEWRGRLRLWAERRDLGYRECNSIMWAGQIEGQEWKVKELTTEAFAEPKSYFVAGYLRPNRSDSCIADNSRMAGAETQDDLERIALSFTRIREIEFDRLLSGDYCFFIWDSLERCCHIWRDPLGIGSLYFCETDGALLISPSLPGLLSLRDCGVRFNRELLAYFLLCGHKPFATSESYAEGVKQVRPGCRMTVSARGTTEATTWTINSIDCSYRSDPHEYSTAFLERLSRSLTTRVPQDELVWFDLSGGLDSTTLSYLGQEHFGRTTSNRMMLRSITRSHFPEFAEKEYIEEARRGLDAPHRYYLYERTELLSAALDDKVNWEEPWMGYVTWYETDELCDDIRQSGSSTHVSGHGADHLLSPPSFLHLLYLLYTREPRRFCNDLCAWVEIAREPMTSFFLRRVLSPAIHPKKRIPSPIPAPWLGGRFPELLRDECKALQTFRLLRMINASSWHHIGNAAVFANYVTSAFASRGVRAVFPFLDLEVIKSILSIPPQDRVRPPYPKSILREAVKGLIPERIRLKVVQPRGDVPITAKLRGSSETIDSLLDTSLLGDLQLIDVSSAKTNFHRLMQGDITFSFHLLSTLSAEMWLRKIMNIKSERR